MKNGIKLGRLIKLIHLSFENNRNAVFARYDMTSSQMELLQFLDEQPKKEATQKAIVEYLQISYATVSGLIKRLEAKEYITRSGSDTDSRVSVIRLAPAAQTLFAVCHQYLEAQDQYMTQDFTPEEEEMLVTLLGKLLKNAARKEETA